MKLAGVLVTLMSLASFNAHATGKISIAEMKEKINLYVPGAKYIDWTSIDDNTKCADLQKFLTYHNVVANGADGQPTDISNVVECKN